jgi:hypothetical protein
MQTAWVDLIANTDNGVTLSDKVNAIVHAILSSHEGVAAPPNPVRGQVWLDSSTAGIDEYKFYTGTAWVQMGVLTHSTGLFTLSGMLPLAGGTMSGAIRGFGNPIAPPFSFSGDEGTGMYRYNAGVIGFAANQLTAARLDKDNLFTNGWKHLTIGEFYLRADADNRIFNFDAGALINYQTAYKNFIIRVPSKTVPGQAMTLATIYDGHFDVAGNLRVMSDDTGNGDTGGPWRQLILHGKKAGRGIAALAYETDTRMLYLSADSTTNKSASLSGATGNFTILGDALKPAGGLWTAISDARMKTDVRSYTGGLSSIVNLRPVTFRYTDDTGYDTKPQHIGLIAQEAEKIMPEMVSTQKGTIDGRQVDDLRSMDTTPLIFALVNAVKELKAEVDDLRSRLAAVTPN